MGVNNQIGGVFMLLICLTEQAKSLSFKTSLQHD